MANTTPAAAIVSTITGRDPEEVVGIGANLPTDKLANKIDVSAPGDYVESAKSAGWR